MLNNCKFSQQLAILDLTCRRNTVKVACVTKQTSKFPPRYPLTPSKITEIPFAVIQYGLPRKPGPTSGPLKNGNMRTEPLVQTCDTRSGTPLTLPGSSPSPTQKKTAAENQPTLRVSRVRVSLPVNRSFTRFGLFNLSTAIVGSRPSALGLVIRPRCCRSRGVEWNMICIRTRPHSGYSFERVVVEPFANVVGRPGLVYRQPSF